MMLDYYIIIS